MDCIMAIKDKYAKQVLLGKKLVDFRKQKMKPCENVWLYLSASGNIILGYFKYNEPICGQPHEIYEAYKDIGGIHINDYNAYFNGCDVAYAYPFNEFVSCRLDASTVPGFKPPQGFLYVDSILPGIRTNMQQNALPGA